MKDSNIRNKINIIKNVILNTEYKKDPRIWWVLIQSLNGDGKYQDDCGVRTKQSPKGASIFILSEKGRSSLWYWKLEKAQWGLWGRSVVAQSSMVLKTEIWRRLSSLEYHRIAINKEKSKNKNKDTLQAHSVLVGSKEGCPYKSWGPQAEKSHCPGYWSAS